MTTRQRAQATPPAKEKTLAELQALVPTGTARLVPLGYSGPWQIHVGKVVIANLRDRSAAEYITRLWNTIAPAFEKGGEATSGELPSAPQVQTPPPSRGRRGGGVIRRKAGKTAQVVP